MNKQKKKQTSKQRNKNIGLQGYLRATQERLLRDLASRILYLQPCISNFTLHTPAFTPLTTHFTLRASQFHTSHLRVQISHLTHHNSRLTHSTSHLTRHILWLHQKTSYLTGESGNFVSLHGGKVMMLFNFGVLQRLCFYGQTQNMNSPVSHVLSILAA